jgi:hypothetical protein
MPRSAPSAPRAALAAVAALAVALPLAAQAPARTVRSNSGVWLQAVGDYRVAPRWALHGEGQHRRANLASEHNQSFLRLGANYDAVRSGALRVGAGVLLARSDEYGDVPSPDGVPERRTWQQLLVNATAGRVGLQQRFRLEQRWVGDVPADGGPVRAWPLRHRVRSQFRATIPFRPGPIRPGDLYAATFDELFVSFGSRVGTNLFDQNRAAALLGWQARPGLRVEGGYLNVTVAKANGATVEVNHLLLLSLSHAVALR